MVYNKGHRFLTTTMIYNIEIISQEKDRVVFLNTIIDTFNWYISITF